MTKRIIVSGYYGFGNTGDEAVLDGMLASLRLAGVDARVTVLSADPARTIAAHPGVMSIHRYKPAQVLRGLAASDLVISGGGSLMQDVSSAKSVYYYLAVIRLAQMLGRRTMVFAQGIGPLTRSSARTWVARVLNKTSAITVRDLDSAQLLESIGVKRPVDLVADPAFLVEPDLEAADRILASNGLAGKELIGVALRPWAGSEDWLQEAARTIGRVCDELGARAVVIPMQPDQDAGNLP